MGFCYIRNSISYLHQLWYIFILQKKKNPLILHPLIPILNILRRTNRFTCWDVEIIVLLVTITSEVTKLGEQFFPRKNLTKRREGRWFPITASRFYERI